MKKDNKFGFGEELSMFMGLFKDEKERVSYFVKRFIYFLEGISELNDNVDSYIIEALGSPQALIEALESTRKQTEQIIRVKAQAVLADFENYVVEAFKTKTENKDLLGLEEVKGELVIKDPELHFASYPNFPEGRFVRELREELKTKAPEIPAYINDHRIAQLYALIAQTRHRIYYEETLSKLRKELGEEKAKTAKKALTMSRHSRHLLDSKFKKRAEQEKQLVLNFAKDYVAEQYESAGFTEGIELTYYEHRALSGIINLLTETRYKGHRQEWVESKDYHYRGMLPILDITQADFLRACFKELDKTSDYSDDESRELVKGLFSIASTNFPVVYGRLKREKVQTTKGKVVEKLVLKNGEKTYDVIATFAPLITITIVWNDATQTEYGEIAKGNFQAGSRKISRLVIRPTPLLTDEIKNYFVEIPATLFIDCKKVLKRHDWKPSKYPPLFIEWLHKQSVWESKANLKIHYLKLAEALKMFGLIDARYWKRIKEILRKCYIVAYELDYLKEFPQSGAGIIQGWDNKRRCGFTIDGADSDGVEVFTLNEEAFTALNKKKEALPEPIWVS